MSCCCPFNFSQSAGCYCTPQSCSLHNCRNPDLLNKYVGNFLRDEKVLTGQRRSTQLAMHLISAVATLFLATDILK